MHPPVVPPRYVRASLAGRYAPAPGPPGITRSQTLTALDAPGSPCTGDFASVAFPPRPRHARRHSVDAQVDRAALPAQPSQWTPRQLARYLSAVLSLPTPIANDIASFVHRTHLSGRSFLRLSDTHMQQLGINVLWREALSEARRHIAAQESQYRTARGIPCEEYDFEPAPEVPGPRPPARDADRLIPAGAVDSVLQGLAAKRGGAGEGAEMAPSGAITLRQGLMTSPSSSSLTDAAPAPLPTGAESRTQLERRSPQTPAFTFARLRTTSVPCLKAESTRSVGANSGENARESARAFERLIKTLPPDPLSSGLPTSPSFLASPWAENDAETPEYYLRAENTEEDWTRSWRLMSQAARKRAPSPVRSRESSVSSAITRLHSLSKTRHRKSSVTSLASIKVRDLVSSLESHSSPSTPTGQDMSVGFGSRSFSQFGSPEASVHSVVESGEMISPTLAAFPRSSWGELALPDEEAAGLGHAEVNSVRGCSHDKSRSGGLMGPPAGPVSREHTPVSSLNSNLFLTPHVDSPVTEDAPAPPLRLPLGFESSSPPLTSRALEQHNRAYLADTDPYHADTEQDHSIMDNYPRVCVDGAGYETVSDYETAPNYDTASSTASFYTSVLSVHTETGGGYSTDEFFSAKEFLSAGESPSAGDGYDSDSAFSTVRPGGMLAAPGSDALKKRKSLQSLFGIGLSTSTSSVLLSDASSSSLRSAETSQSSAPPSTPPLSASNPGEDVFSKDADFLGSSRDADFPGPSRDIGVLGTARTSGDVPPADLLALPDTKSNCGSVILVKKSQLAELKQRMEEIQEKLSQVERHDATADILERLNRIELDYENRVEHERNSDSTRVLLDKHGYNPIPNTLMELGTYCVAATVGIGIVAGEVIVSKLFGFPSSGRR